MPATEPEVEIEALPLAAVSIAATGPLPMGENEAHETNGDAKTAVILGSLNGGRRGCRTPDPLRVKQLLYR